MSLFKDQNAVITGASSGIGKAIASALASNGASLCIVGRNLITLKKVAEEANVKGARVKSYQVDLSVDDDIKKLGQKIQEDFGRIDMLIHSAGTFHMGDLEHSLIEDFDKQYRINVHAPYLLTQTLLQSVKACAGQIVFINSSAGLKAKAKVGQYAATKHALKAVADSLREEVNGEGIRVLSVYPGRTATPMQEAVHKMEGRPYRPERFMQPEDVAAVVLNSLILPRSAEVTDINIRSLTKMEDSFYNERN